MITISEFEGVTTRKVKGSESARKIEELEKRFIATKEAYKSIQGRLETLENVLQTLEKELKEPFSKTEETDEKDIKQPYLHLVLMDEFVHTKLDSSYYELEMAKIKTLITHYSSIARIIAEDMCNKELNGTSNFSSDDMSLLITKYLTDHQSDEVFKEKAEEVLKSEKFKELFDRMFS